MASFLANGLSADEMYQVIDGTHPTIRPIAREHIFNFNQGEFLRRMVGIPKHLALAWYTSLRHLNEVTLVDILWSLSDALPSGLYDGMALERYMRSVLTMPGRSNCFSDLGNRLHVIATDLNTGERAVFGGHQCDDVPISLAVAASSAVPMLYKPVCIGDHEYIDGGMRGTASIDLAIEQGATLVVCVNPLVPYSSTMDSEAARAESLSARGVPAIASQVTRITSHAGLRYQIKQLRRQHPEVDIILIEPQPTDQRMFYGNIMHYQARLEVARHGFESVTAGSGRGLSLLQRDAGSPRRADHATSGDRGIGGNPQLGLRSGGDPAGAGGAHPSMRPTSAQHAVLPAPTDARAIGAGTGRSGDGLTRLAPLAGAWRQLSTISDA